MLGVMPRLVLGCSYVPAAGAQPRTQDAVLAIATRVRQALPVHKCFAHATSDRLEIVATFQAESEPTASSMGRGAIHDAVTHLLPDWRLDDFLRLTM
jgi:hypothetical protein